MRKFTYLIALVLAFSLLFPSCSSLPEETLTTGEENTVSQTDDLEKDPSKDDILNVLMIGNSFCTNFSDEILGLAKEHGINMRIYNVYYSGCRLKWHWEWFYTRDKNYSLYSYTSSNPSRSIEDNVNLEFCLSKADWDVISLQQHFDPSVAEFYDASMETCTPYAQKLVDILKERFPKAELVWHQTWAYEIGYQGPSGSDPNAIEENKKVLTLEKQTACYESIRDVSLELCKSLSLKRVPSGDAWQIARGNQIIGDTLCNSSSKNDKYHDGDIGGGQYLNACTWFEVLTGKNCIGNTWRPSYDLSEEKIAALQEAAHKAVMDAKGN